MLLPAIRKSEARHGHLIVFLCKPLQPEIELASPGLQRSQISTASRLSGLFLAPSQFGSPSSRATVLGGFYSDGFWHQLR